MDLQFCGSKTLNACNKEKMLKKNHVNELPNDVLLHALSSSTMREAGRTSVVSKTLRYAWCDLPILNFDSCHIAHEISVEKKAREVKMPWYDLPDKHKYIQWVDQVISSYNPAFRVGEFRVQSGLVEESGRSIDNWLKFAIEKRVKRLGMDF